MANDKPDYYGDIENSAFETVGRSDSWAENREAQFQIIGQYKKLEGLNIQPADSMSRLSEYIDVNSQYYVKTVTLTKEDGDVGVMNISAVKCPEGVEKPYNEVWESSMDEVQKKLINHPDVRAHCKLDELWKWMDTPARYRVTGSGDEAKYYYTTGEVMGDEPELKEITGSWEKKYCAAVIAGIETFNLYLPVVSRTSYYLKLPGVTYNGEHVAKSGTIELTDEEKIGTFDKPDVEPSCTPKMGTKKGRWFKSMDKISENADGSCTRTEQWTYTNDTDHSWIYGD